MAATATTPLTRAQQDCLEAVLSLTRDAPGGAALADVATALKVRPSSAAEAVGQLKAQGLLAQAPRGRITLSDTGRACAESVAERHETLRSFFSDVLKVAPATADRDACKAEHALSPETSFRLKEFLEHINADQIEQDGALPLTLLRKGDTGILKRVSGNRDKHQRLAAMGLRIGAGIRVIQNSRGGPVMVQADRTRVAIGRSIATCLHVLPTAPHP